MILTKKGQISTSKEALLYNNSEFAKKLLRYRELHKITNTYLKPLKENVDSNNRIHALFNQAKTITGRLSSSNPINLQNIPSRSELGKQVRELFIPEKGNKLIVADFSQIELRLIAHFSQDKNMIKAYKEGIDIHEQTAKVVFNKPSPTKDERFIGKTLNFAVSYGAGPKILARTINLSGLDKKVTDDEAKEYLDRFNGLYPGINAWKRGVWYTTKHLGYIKTLLGRKILIDGFNGSWKDQSRAERESISYLIQGSATDVMKKGILDCLSEYDLKIVSTVHDELIIEVANYEVSLMLNKIKEVLEHAKIISIPLIVDAKPCSDWGEK